MGKRGPIPKKTFLKVLSGNLPISKDNFGDELIQKFNPPDFPPHFSAEEKAVWNKTLELLKPLKFIENIDGAILAAYCCSYVRWVAAEKQIKNATRKSKLFYGLLAPGAGGGLIISPLVNISRRAQADMVLYAAQLGMTPAARLRVQVSKSEPPEDNPFARLKNDKKNQLDADG